VAKKLNLQFVLLYLRYMWREVGWLKMSYGGGGLKLLKKHLMIFKRSPTVLMVLWEE